MGELSNGLWSREGKFCYAKLEQSIFYFFFFGRLVVSFFIFNWRIIALQYCVRFCRIATWISHRFMYVPSLLNLPPNSHPISITFLIDTVHEKSLTLPSFLNARNQIKGKNFHNLKYKSQTGFSDSFKAWINENGKHAFL